MYECSVMIHHFQMIPEVPYINDGGQQKSVIHLIIREHTYRENTYEEEILYKEDRRGVSRRIEDLRYDCTVHQYYSIKYYPQSCVSRYNHRTDHPRYSIG